MTLKDTMEDAERQMREAFVELRREAAEVDRLKTACQRSHRCWPSLTMFGGLIALLLLNWFLAYGDSQQLTEEIQQAKTDILVSVETQIQQAMVVRPVRPAPAPRHW